MQSAERSQHPSTASNSCLRSIAHRALPFARSVTNILVSNSWTSWQNPMQDHEMGTKGLLWLHREWALAPWQDHTRIWRSNLGDCYLCSLTCCRAIRYMTKAHAAYLSHASNDNWNWACRAWALWQMRAPSRRTSEAMAQMSWRIYLRRYHTCPYFVCYQLASQITELQCWHGAIHFPPDWRSDRFDSFFGQGVGLEKSIIGLRQSPKRDECRLKTADWCPCRQWSSPWMIG